MTNSTVAQTLTSIADRVALVVTNLNGLSSAIVNDEVTPADFNHDLTILENKLDQVEETVSQLTAVFEGAVPQSVYTVVVTEQVTCQVWYLVTDVPSVVEAIAAYRRGQCRETERIILSVDASRVDDARQEV